MKQHIDPMVYNDPKQISAARVWDNGDGHHADCMATAAPVVIVIGLAARWLLHRIRR